MDKIDEIMNGFIASLGYDGAETMFSRVSSGKKLRSKLILKIAGENERAFTLCAVIELIHLASLLHDDVIDESNLRRGSPSINALFGAKNAVMLGDVLYSKGYNELVKFDPEVARVVSDAVCKLSIGELMDVQMGEAFNVDLEKYEKMIYFKTAVLIEAAAKSAAMISNLNPQIYAEYGKNLGLAFQIIDDVLDIASDEATLGKPAMQDFAEGKTTLPYILLYERMEGDDRTVLLNLFKKPLGEGEKGWLRLKFESTGALKEAVKIAREYGERALEATPNSNLKEIAQSMIDRKF